MPFYKLVYVKDRFVFQTTTEVIVSNCNIKRCHSNLYYIFNEKEFFPQCYTSFRIILIFRLSFCSREKKLGCAKWQTFVFLANNIGRYTLHIDTGTDIFVKILKQLNPVILIYNSCFVQ